MDAAFEADAFEELAVGVPGAHLQLRPHDQADRVQVYGSVPEADPETARALFNRKEISTHHSGDRLVVYGKRLSADISDWRWRRDHRTTVRFEVHVPPDLAVVAQVPGGIVDASSLAGPLELNVPGGSVRADEITGPLHVRGSGGSLAIHDTTDAALDLEWGAGSVTLERLRTTDTTLQARAAPTTVREQDGSADLEVQGAGLTLEALSGPCQATVHGGTLTYEGAPDHETSLRTVGGALRASLPSGHAAALSLVGPRVGLDDAFAFEGTRTARRIEGRLNGGGPAFHGSAADAQVHCSVLKSA